MTLTYLGVMILMHVGWNDSTDVCSQVWEDRSGEDPGGKWKSRCQHQRKCNQ